MQEVWDDPWVGKIPWRRKWQPTPVFLPWKSYRQRILAGYGPWGHKRVGHDLATKQQQQQELWMDLKNNGQKFNKKLNIYKVSKYISTRYFSITKGSHRTVETLAEFTLPKWWVNTAGKKYQTARALWYGILRKTQHHFCGIYPTNE